MSKKTKEYIGQANNMAGYLNIMHQRMELNEQKKQTNNEI